MRPWHRRALPPQILSHMRPRFSIRNGNVKGKAMNNAKKVSKLEVSNIFNFLILIKCNLDNNSIVLLE